MYDPRNNSWSDLPPMSSARFGAAAAAVNGRLYVTGGFDKTSLNTVEMYDPTANKWSVTQSMSTPRMLHAALEVEGKLFALGGYGAGATTFHGLGAGLVSSMEVYNPNITKWVGAPPNMSVAHTAFQAVLLVGRLYAVSGGAIPDGPYRRSLRSTVALQLETKAEDEAGGPIVERYWNGSLAGNTPW